MSSRNVAYLVEPVNRHWSENESALYCTSRSRTCFPSFLFCIVLWTGEFQGCSAWMEVGLCSHSSWCSATHSSKSLHVNKNIPYQRAIARTQKARVVEQVWMTWLEEELALQLSHPTDMLANCPSPVIPKVRVLHECVWKLRQVQKACSLGERYWHLLHSHEEMTGKRIQGILLTITFIICVIVFTSLKLDWKNPLTVICIMEQIRIYDARESLMFNKENKSWRERGGRESYSILDVGWNKFSYMTPMTLLITLYTADKLWFNLLLHCAAQFLSFTSLLLAPPSSG